MKNVSCLLLIFFAMAIQNTQAQKFSLDTYRWENRLILIVAENPKDGKIEEQLKLFQHDQEALTDRKFLIFKIDPKGSTLYGPSLNPVQNTENKNLYEEFVSDSMPFQILLIGLDGGVKMKRTRITDPSVFFSEIDTMPMRRNEMRGK